MWTRVKAVSWDLPLIFRLFCLIAKLSLKRFASIALLETRRSWSIMCLKVGGKIGILSGWLSGVASHLPVAVWGWLVESLEATSLVLRVLLLWRNAADTSVRCWNLETYHCSSWCLRCMSAISRCFRPLDRLEHIFFCELVADFDSVLAARCGLRKLVSRRAQHEEERQSDPFHINVNKPNVPTKIDCELHTSNKVFASFYWGRIVPSWCLTRSTCQMIWALLAAAQHSIPDMNRHVTVTN